MTSMKLWSFDAYDGLLQEALQNEDRSTSGLALALGEAAAATGASLQELVDAHHQALARHLPGAADAPAATERAGACLAALLSGYELAQRAQATAQQALSQQPTLEQISELLLERVPAFAYVAQAADERRGFLYVAPQAEAITGFPIARLITEEDLWPGRILAEDRGDVLTRQLAAREEGIAYMTEYRILRNDDEIVWIHDEATLQEDEVGRPLFWVGVMLDITARKQAEREAVIGERDRLARELHDSVTQTLHSAAMLTSFLPRLWEQNPEQGRQQLGQLDGLIRGAIAEMRALLLELRPTGLTETPLDTLVGQLLASLRARAGIEAEAEMEHVAKLPAEVQLTFYRIAQESLNNIVKHAGATHVSLRLGRLDGLLELRVADDGRGFDPESTPPGRFGLQIMEERAARIGACYSVQSAPGQGTEVRLRWKPGATK